MAAVEGTSLSIFFKYLLYYIARFSVSLHESDSEQEKIAVENMLKK